MPFKNALRRLSLFHRSSANLTTLMTSSSVHSPPHASPSPIHSASTSALPSPSSPTTSSSSSPPIQSTSVTCRRASTSESRSHSHSRAGSPSRRRSRSASVSTCSTTSLHLPNPYSIDMHIEPDGDDVVPVDTNADDSFSFDANNFAHISTYLNSPPTDLDHTNDALAASHRLPDITFDAPPLDITVTNPSLDIDHRTDVSESTSTSIDADSVSGFPNPYSIDGHEPLPVSHPIRRQSMQPFQLAALQPQPVQYQSQPIRTRDDLEQRRRRRSTAGALSARDLVSSLPVSLALPLPLSSSSLSSPRTRAVSMSASNMDVFAPFDFDIPSSTDAAAGGESLVGGGVEEKRLAEGMAAGVAAATAGVGALAMGEAGEDEKLDKGKGKAVDLEVDEAEDEENDTISPLPPKAVDQGEGLGLGLGSVGAGATATPPPPPSLPASLMPGHPQSSTPPVLSSAPGSPSSKEEFGTPTTTSPTTGVPSVAAPAPIVPSVGSPAPNVQSGPPATNIPSVMTPASEQNATPIIFASTTPSGPKTGIQTVGKSGKETTPPPTVRTETDTTENAERERDREADVEPAVKSNEVQMERDAKEREAKTKAASMGPPGAAALAGVGEKDAKEEAPEGLKEGGATTTPHKKPRFMDRVKGEIKALSGKFGGDKAKVEEGKKMVHGE